MKGRVTSISTLRDFFFPSLMADPVRPRPSLVPRPSLLPSVGADDEHFVFPRFVSLRGLLLPTPPSPLSVTPIVGRVGTDVPAALFVRVLTGEGDLSGGGREQVSGRGQICRRDDSGWGEGWR